MWLLAEDRYGLVGSWTLPKHGWGVPQNILTAASSCLLHPWEGTTGNKQEPVQVSTQSSCSERLEGWNRAQQ